MCRAIVQKRVVRIKRLYFQHIYALLVVCIGFRVLQGGNHGTGRILAEADVHGIFSGNAAAVSLAPAAADTGIIW